MHRAPATNFRSVPGTSFVGGAARGCSGWIPAVLLALVVAGCGDERAVPRLVDGDGIDPLVLDTIARTADAVEKASGNPRGWAQLGELYYAHDYLDSALRCFDAAIELGPEDPKAWYLRGVVRKRQGDDRGAIEDIEAAIRLDTETPHVRWRAAHWYREAGDLERAERLATDAVKLSKGDRNSRRTLALVALEAGRPEQAIKLLQPIVRANPKDRETRSTLVRAWGMSGDQEAAEREAILAGDVKPNYFDPWLDAAITRRTDLPFWIRRAQRISRQGDPVSGRRILESVLKRWYPDAREVGYTEGVILMAEDRHAESAVLFESLVAVHPDWSQAMMMAAAAMIADGGGDPATDQRAAKLLQRSMEIEPNNDATRLMMVGILGRSGDLDRARGLMEALVESQGWVVQHRLELADLQRRSGDPEAALITLDQAQNVFGPSLGINLKRAAALLDLDRLDEAAAEITLARSRADRPLAEIRRLEIRLQKASLP